MFLTPVVLFLTFHSVHSQVDFDNILGLLPSFNLPINKPSNDFQDVIDTFIEGECSKQLQMVIEGFKRSDKWALEMIDSSAKPQAGILYGNIMHIGNYDQCIKIYKELENSTIEGMYCANVMLQSKPSEEPVLTEEIIVALRMSYGICIPKACSPQEIENLSNYLLQNHNVTGYIWTPSNFCDWKTKTFPITTTTIFGIVIFAFFGVLMLLSTLYDIFIFQKATSARRKLYITFSVYTNGLKLFNTKTTEGTLTCLNGLRVLSMCWVLLGHRYMYGLYLPIINLVEVPDFIDRPSSFLILSASMSVDTFFTVSGFLVAYIYLNSITKGAKISIPKFYLHRILRLSPAFLMVILLCISFYIHLGSGPFWPVATDVIKGTCEENWWTSIFYLQNYINVDRSCVSQAWYLAADTQMYFISPLLLLPLVKWPKRTISAIITLEFIIIGYSFYLCYVKELKLMFFGSDEDQFKKLYAPTHIRIVSWFVGFIAGYILFQIKDKKIILMKKTILIIWIFCFTIFGIIFYLHYLLGRDELNTLEAALFNSFVRPIWCLVISIIVLMCAKGFGGPVNKILSWPIFNVMIRLNYSMYLLHINVLFFFLMQKRTSEHFSNLQRLHEFWGDLFFTLLLSIVWVLAFESPILAIEKIIFNSKKVSDSSTYIENNDIANGNCKIINFKNLKNEDVIA